MRAALPSQGAPLADNLRRHLQGAPLRPWHPQFTHLNIISTGDKYGVAVKGWLGAQGGYWWSAKDWIDKKFMSKYGDELDFEATMAMASGGSGGGAAATATPEALALATAAKMRCGGCGGKVGASVLTQVLRRLQKERPALATRSDVLVGLGAGDDAAVLAAPPPGHVSVHTVDFFKAPLPALSDPFAFGTVAATHALSDCHAMGAEPRAALAVAVLPFAAPAKVQADLYQLLSGAATALEAAGCALVGGHTSEGAELSLGFSVYGTARPEALLKRSGLQPGQALLLSKPLGTGAVMAAAAGGAACALGVAAAVDSMLRSNAQASLILQQHGATACVDVTGFGLLGHAAELAAASHVALEIDPGTVPLLPGAAECLAAGALSSLHAENTRVAAVVFDAEAAAALPVWPLLVDPQTSGGLLAGVPADRATACLEALRASGCVRAAIVGRVVAGIDGGGGKLLALHPC